MFHQVQWHSFETTQGSPWCIHLQNWYSTSEKEPSNSEAEITNYLIRLEVNFNNHQQISWFIDVESVLFALNAVPSFLRRNYLVSSSLITSLQSVITKIRRKVDDFMCKTTTSLTTPGQPSVYTNSSR